MAISIPSTEASQWKVALAQMSPVWLDRQRTIEKILDHIGRAASAGAGLIAFSEACLPGYPFWTEHTDGARFNSKVQKEIFAHYADQAVTIELGHLDPICKAAAAGKIWVYLGMIERPQDRGGHSLYCAFTAIDSNGAIRSVQRKLVPTYDERLVWSHGDGNGLVVHSVGPFTVGALNCWENWMPLVRSSLYAQGENLHIANWPGGDHNTRDITRFIAMESRSYVLSVAGLMRKEDIGSNVPHADLIRGNCPDVLANGGSCIAGPDGKWIIEPTIGREELIFATLDARRILEERQNFDPSGHYSRADVTQLTVNRKRQRVVEFQ